ncbi:unnamed protein product, partial [Brassica oleracea var. botrytis]
QDKKLEQSHHHERGEPQDSLKHRTETRVIHALHAPTQRKGADRSEPLGQEATGWVERVTAASYLLRSGTHTPTTNLSSHGGPLLHLTTRRPRTLQRNKILGQAQRRCSRADRRWPSKHHRQSLLL